MTIKKYKPRKSNTRKFQSKSNRRDTRQERGYDGAWYAYRARFLKRNPKCYVCGCKDNLHIDHIVPHKGDKKIFWDIYNFMPLCHSCHSVVTARFDRKEIPDTEGKIKWVQKMRKLNGVNLKVKPVSLK